MSEPRCSFCGWHPSFPHRHRPVAWQDVAGRLVCDAECAEKEAARQAAEPAPQRIGVDEIDGRRVVDQVRWAAEQPRKESDVSDSTAYQGWAIVELMGHRRLAGRVSEVTQYGTTQLRLDVPGEGDAFVATQFYSGGALYCVTPTDEKTARAVARLGRPEPVQRWELPTPRREEEPARESDGDETEESEDPDDGGRDTRAAGDVVDF